MFFYGCPFMRGARYHVIAEEGNTRAHRSSLSPSEPSFGSSEQVIARPTKGIARLEHHVYSIALPQECGRCNQALGIRVPGRKTGKGWLGGPVRRGMSEVSRAPVVVREAGRPPRREGHPEGRCRPRHPRGDDTSQVPDVRRPETGRIHILLDPRRLEQEQLPWTSRAIQDPCAGGISGGAGDRRTA